MHAKSKISGMLPKSFKPGKCKTSLKLAVSRMKLLKNKREALVKQMRRDVAQLLETGQEQTARIRVEHVIREEKTMSAYDLIEIYCELIESRLPIIESQKNCPIDLKEAISSVIFASPRCADIPELTDIRKHFTAKYGKEFVNAALEIRPDCGVSRMMVEKLSAMAPDVQTKIKVLNAVAKEHNIQWNSKAFEEQAQKPKDDLLSGPSSFISAEKMTVKSSDVKPSPLNSWNDESATKVPQNNIASQPKEVKSTYAEEESVSMHRTNWKMEFKDATSAAEAAAESAERASMAARAAAELASRGNISRQSSGGLYESPAYVSKSEGPESVKSSFLGSNYVAGASESMEDEKRKGSHFVKPKVQNPQKDDFARTSTLTEDEILNSNHTARGNGMSDKSHISGSSSNRVVSHVDIQDSVAKSYDFVQESFTDIGCASKNLTNDNNENYEQEHDVLAYSAYSSMFDDYTSKGDHDNKTKGESSDVFYDNYDSDTDDHSVLGRYSERNLLDSFLPQPREEPSSFSVNLDSWSHKQRTTGPLSNEGSSQLHSLVESHQTDYSETIRKANLHSNSDDDLPPKYDFPKFDSEGRSSDTEDEVEKPKLVGDVRPSSFLHTDSTSRKSSPPAQPSHRTNLINDTTEDDEGNQSSPSAVFPGTDNLDVEPSSNDNNWRSGFSMRNNRKTQINERSPNSDDTGRGATEELSYTVTSDEGYESGALNYGRLTGGFRNRGYTRPPYVRNTITDSSLSSKTNSDVTSPTNEKEISSSVSKFSTSIEFTSEEKFSKDLHTNVFRPEERASSVNVDTELDNEGGQSAKYDAEGRGSRYAGSFTSLNRSSDDTSTLSGRPVSSHHSKTYEDLENPIHESYVQPRQRKDYKESILRSSVTDSSIAVEEEQIYTAGNQQWRESISTPKSQKLDVSSSTEKSTVYHPSKISLNSGDPEHGLYRQKPHAAAYDDDSSPRKPINYSSLDGHELGEPELKSTSVRGGNTVVRLSRRTRVKPSVVKEDTVPITSEDSVKESAFSRQSPAAGSSGTIKHTGNLDNRESYKPQHLKTESSNVRGSPKLSQGELRQSSFTENNANPKNSSSSEKSTSRQSSFTSNSHVHPKLPDYDSIAAHFQSLRANVRPK